MKEVEIKFITDTKQVDKSLKKTTKGVDGLKKSADKSVKSSKGMAAGLTSSFGALKTGILGAVPALRAFAAALVSTGVGAIVVIMGSLFALFKSAADEGAAFGKELSTLRAITGKTTKELKGLSDQAKELGGSTQFTAGEVVKLQTELAKLGFTIKDISNATPAILDLAASLEIDLASAASFAGSTVRAFGLTTKDTQEVVDLMAKSTSVSALNFGALQESIKVVAPTARATNVSLTKTTALLALLADNGMLGGMAGTGLGKVFIELNRKGITLNDAMVMVSSSSNSMNTAFELVGLNGSKALNTLAANADKLQPLIDKLEDADGAARRLAEVRLDNLAGDTTKLSSAWSGFLLNIEDGTGVLNRLSRYTIQSITIGIGRLVKGITLLGVIWDNVFTAIPAHFEGTKDVLVGGFGVLSSTITIFANNAKLAISTIPIIGQAIDVNQVTKNIMEAEKELTKSQNRLLVGQQKQTAASNLITYGGIMATYAAEMAKVKIINDAAEEIKDITEDPTTDPVADESAKLKKIQDIKDYYFLKGLEREISKIERKTDADILELEALKGQKELIEQIEQDSADRIAAIVKKASDKAKEANKEVVVTKVEEENIGIQSIQSLNMAASNLANVLNDKDAGENEERAKKNFEVQKKFKLAIGAMTVTEGIMNAFSQTSDFTPTQTLRQINAGVAAAIGLANLAAIARTSYESGGGVSGNAGDSAQAPSFNLVEGSEGNQIQNSIQNSNATPLRAFVVAQDVTSQQSLDRQIENNSGI